MAFKPQIHEVELVDGEDNEKFYIREPSGREILTAAGSKKERPPIENAKDLFQKYVVHQDGKAYSKEEVDELLEMRLTAMHKLSLLVQEKIGLKQVTEGKAE